MGLIWLTGPALQNLILQSQQALGSSHLRVVGPDTPARRMCRYVPALVACARSVPAADKATASATLRLLLASSLRQAERSAKMAALLSKAVDRAPDRLPLLPEDAAALLHTIAAGALHPASVQCPSSESFRSHVMFPPGNAVLTFAPYPKP